MRHLSLSFKAATKIGNHTVRVVPSRPDLTWQRRAGSAAAPIDDDDAEERGPFGDDCGDDSDDPLAAELAALDAALRRTERALEREERDPLIYDLDWDEVARLAEWREAVDLTAGLPPVLASALVAALWDDIAPLQHAPWLGPLLAAACCVSAARPAPICFASTPASARPQSCG